jgi:predicted DNA-binding protein
MTVKQLTAPTTIRIEPEIKTWLLQESHRQNRTVSNLINTILKREKELNNHFYVMGERLEALMELAEKTNETNTQ